MTTLNEKLTRIMDIEDERDCAFAFEAICKEHFEELPLPGENALFDRAMWNASEFMMLSTRDEAMVERITERLIGQVQTVPQKVVLQLKDLVGATRETAINTWQDMLASLQWQQMVPAGAMRGVGSQLISLGTFEREVDQAKIQVNLGWLVDKDQLRLLMQAKDLDQKAMADVEVRITETERGVVFSRKTNEDGAVVAPAVKVGPGEYQIQVFWTDQVLETPFFKI